MAESKKASGTPKQNGGWKAGTLQLTAREVHRQGASATAHTTGLLEFNVSATKASDDVARDRGLQPEAGYVFKYYTNGEMRQLGLVPQLASGPGTIGVNRYKDGSSERLSTHAGPAYLEEPKLKPVIKSRCKLWVENLPDDGLPMLVIALKAGTGKGSRSRKGSSGTKATKKNDRKGPDQPTNKAPDQPASKAPDKSANKAPDQPASKAPKG
ncbi:MAG: hypothetical protein ACOY93_21995 [Bacillota bacterium]